MPGTMGLAQAGSLDVSPAGKARDPSDKESKVSCSSTGGW